MDLQAGSKVGNYVLDAYLGGGSFGAVWRGHDEATGEPVAVKLLTGALSSSETASMRANVELLAAAAASRSHHVVRVLGGGSEPVPNIVMEFVDGSDLQTLLKDQATLSADKTIEVGIAITDALRALNEAGIYHRDIKPANVMIDKSGVIKLADFGIAKIVGYETITMTGQAAMTMAYAAPEVWDEDSMFGRPSHKSDLYATGILLYQCLTGATPFRGNYGALYKAHVEKAPDIASLPESTPPSLRLLIGRCLEKRQDDRPRDAAECVAILERAKVEVAEFGGRFPAGEPKRFGAWVRIAPHPSLAWAWRCKNESSGETATVEAHASEDLEYGAGLRRAVAASARLTSLGAERLIDTNRLLLAPDEAWVAQPPGAFQFWIAREDRPAGRVESVSLPALRVALITLATLVDAAAKEGVPLSTRDLSLMPEGHVYARRAGLVKQASEDDIGEGVMTFVRSLPLDGEAKEFLATAPDFRSLVGRARNLGQASTGEVSTRLRNDDIEQQSVMVCRGCHEPMPAGAAFCANCGRSVGRTSDLETMPVAAAAATMVQQPTILAVPPPAALTPTPISLSTIRMQLRKLPAPGDYELTLRNTGAQPVAVQLEGQSEGDRLAVSLPRSLLLPQGANETLKVHVAPRSRRLFGGKRKTIFTVIASGGAGSNEPPLTAEGEFEEQPSALPMFAGAGVLGIGAAAAIFLFALSGGGGDKKGTAVVSASSGPSGLQVLPTVPASSLVIPAATPVPPPVVVAPPVVEAPPNRADCAAIRAGQPYQSDVERSWFLANCGGTSAPTVNTSPPAQPPVSQPPAQPPVSQPPPAAVAPEPPAKPVEPSVTLTCRSSLASATSGPSQQGNQLAAVANETISCSASISGSYTSIDWSGGQTRGSGTSFNVSFPASPPIYNILLEVNWGGNPIKKTVAVTTQAAANSNGTGCTTQQDTQVCVNITGR